MSAADLQRQLTAVLWQRPAWFEDGLRFACQRCGACCTGEPGLVRVDAAELPAIADLLRLSVAQLRAQYLTAADGELALREEANGDCCLWDAATGCRAYAARPEQCRTYPFWLELLRSREAWAAAGRDCPGIGQGPLFDKDRIMEHLR